MSVLSRLLQRGRFDGELIVDVSIGYADRDHGQPVQSSTLFPVFSVTKGLVATAVLRALARRERADPEALRAI